MSLSALPATDAASPGAPKTGVQHQSSRLFPSLFEDIDPNHRLSVFDVGPAIPESIHFLGQFKSRIHITDLYSESLVRTLQKDLCEAEMKQEFHKLLGFKVGTLIDVCLFWDFLNYLSRPALSAFCAALKPYIHAGTRAHGFSVLNVETPLRNHQYGIVSAELLSIRQSTAAQLDYYPHSHEELNASMSCFDVGRGWLLPDGRLEILLKAVI